MKKNIALLPALLMTVFVQAQIQAPVKPAGNQPQIKPNVQLKVDSTGMSKVVYIKPAMITNLCPWIKSRGDNNFENTNQVRVMVNIDFRYNMRNGDSVLKANVQLSGAEQGGDISSVKGEWQKVVYTAPAGWKIRKISNGTTSLATYFEFNANVRDKFNTETGCMVRRYNASNFGFPVTMPTVHSIGISVYKKEGDDFDEAESSCNCGFKIEKIEFKNLYVTLEHL